MAAPSTIANTRNAKHALNPITALRARLGWSHTTSWLFALILIGLALRLWFIEVNVIDPRFSAADDGDYYQRALRLAVTGEYRDDSWLIRPPLHIFVFATLLRFSVLIGAVDLGIPLIRIAQVGLSLMMIPIGYDLARRLFNRQAGWVFATLLAIWFPLVELPALILTEPLFLFLLLLHLWFLVRWRDAQTERTPSHFTGWPWLFSAGLALGLCALARSQALYAAVFVALFIGMTIHVEQRGSNAGLRQWVLATGRWLLAFLIAFIVVIGPWTLRNYMEYQRFIAIDTLGPINLWLALQPHQIDGGKSILANMPQADRQAFVSEDIARIIRADPARLVKNIWPHFTHMWKAQFLEDFLVKPSFYTRPLRAIWPLGALGDLLWFGFVLCSLGAFVAPLREGAFRWLALGWISYTTLTVTLLHIEPRYLLPIWLLMALYGSAMIGYALAQPKTRHGTLHPLRYWRIGVALVLVFGFLYLFFSYRDYPSYITRGIQREMRYTAGARAYAAGDYATAEREFQQATAIHPTFVDNRIDLALALMAQERYDEAWEALGQRHTHRVDVARGAITRAQGKHDLAVAYFTDAERRSGEDVQALTLQWLRPQPTNHLILGNGLDFGYLQGFSFGETAARADGSNQSYRWLQSHGRIQLPLQHPIQAGSVITLYMAGGRPNTTPLRVTFSSGDTTNIPVTHGQWRAYHLPIPTDLVGNRTLNLTFDAPTFIPAQNDPAGADARILSLMISAIEIK